MTKLTAVLAVTAAALISSSAFLEAAPYNYEIGCIKICPCTCQVLMRSHVMLNQSNLSSSITVEFEWIRNSAPGEVPAWADRQAKSLIGVGSDPLFGNYNFTLDASRPVMSRIQAHGATDFPAKSMVGFHVFLTFAGQPGVTYQSMNMVHFENNNLTYWPHLNTPYDQVGTTDFERVDNPGVVAYTLSDARATLTQQN